MATQRYGMVIEVREERLDEYKALHADDNTGVRDLLEKANMHNFSILLSRLPDGRLYLFGYYEYTGDDYLAHMARLDAEPWKQRVARDVRSHADSVPRRIELEDHGGSLPQRVGGGAAVAQ